ncbi:carbohydrate porin [Dyella amyloliquefaciens]|uniref:carbohydrate porin n=1 Tax=Dyella amyloliquefaciens TaxID=1770545 RepID=UPI0013EE43E7|nr:carbohydrate porin [Dyella amyloliquefaciens]
MAHASTSFHGRRGHSISWRSKTFAGLVWLGTTCATQAQEASAPPTWGGDLASRPRLTGDWGELRDDLARKGVQFDVDVLATPIAVVSGGRSTGSNTWSNVDYTLNIDTQKLGLWKGGFINVQADTGLGSMNKRSGAIIAINTATLVPGANERTTVLMNATLTQYFTDAFAVAIGKFNTFDQGAQEFYGDYSSQFLNGAFNFPVTTEQVPQSAFGAGVIFQATKDLNLSVYALDPSGTPDSNDLGEAFDDGVIVTGGAQWTIHPFQRAGHQGLSFAWSDKRRLSLNQTPSDLDELLLQNDFPRLGDIGPTLAQYLSQYFPNLTPGAQAANTKAESWSVNYAFDQYLWQPNGDQTHGVGLFFSFGASDGNPNPIRYAYLAGIGGKGVGPSRPDDNFGIGVASTRFSGTFIPLLRQQLGLGLDREDAIEAYYNVAVTHWLNVTADVQFVSPALKKSLNRTGDGLTSVGNATIVGLRLRARL